MCFCDESQIITVSCNIRNVSDFQGVFYAVGIYPEPRGADIFSQDAQGWCAWPIGEHFWCTRELHLMCLPHNLDFWGILQLTFLGLVSCLIELRFSLDITNSALPVVSRVLGPNMCLLPTKHLASSQKEWPQWAIFHCNPIIQCAGFEFLAKWFINVPLFQMLGNGCPSAVHGSRLGVLCPQRGIWSMRWRCQNSDLGHTCQGTSMVPVCTNS